jgi:hypothetical protein
MQVNRPSAPTSDPISLNYIITGWQTQYIHIKSKWTEGKELWIERFCIVIAMDFLLQWSVC